jgi:2-polyprenyl-6-methoxyphenol hydroxylase-like FAD-dependent oxidoreductase
VPTAIVLGGGIAGLSAAIALDGAGYQVCVHEQAAAIEPIGAALSLWPNAVAALRRLRALDRIAAEAAPISAMLLATRDGRPLLGPWPVGTGRHGERAYLPTRALLQRALGEALGTRVPIRLGRRVAAVADEGDRVRVRFEDGGADAADLVVAADGLWSAVGDALLGNAARPAGYGGVLALSDAVEGPPLDGLAAEYWGAGERFGVLEVGEGCRYWFYMCDAPHEGLTRDALLARAAGWPTAVGAAIRATPAERLIPVTIAARTVPRRLGAGRIVVTGDAAHGMEPNLGQGACQALEDAVALGALAARVAPAAVAGSFTRARLRRVAGVMRRAREGGLAVHGARPVQAALRAGLRLMPGALHRRVVEGLYRLPDY